MIYLYFQKSSHDVGNVWLLVLLAGYRSVGTILPLFETKGQ